MIARSLAGILLGFPLAAGLIALLLQALPEHGQAWLIPGLVILFPLWLGIFAASYLFHTGRSAWLVLASANVPVQTTLWLMRHASQT